MSPPRVAPRIVAFAQLYKLAPVINIFADFPKRLLPLSLFRNDVFRAWPRSLASAIAISDTRGYAAVIFEIARDRDPLCALLLARRSEGGTFERSFARMLDSTQRSHFLPNLLRPAVYSEGHRPSRQLHQLRGDRVAVGESADRHRPSGSTRYETAPHSGRPSSSQSPQKEPHGRSRS